MWYFSWILGVLLAAGFGIINVLWLELVAADAFGEDTETSDDNESAAEHRVTTGENR